MDTFYRPTKERLQGATLRGYDAKILLDGTGEGGMFKKEQLAYCTLVCQQRLC